MARIVFMGTPDFAVPSLQALIASQSVVGVVTQPDRPAGRGRKLQPPPVKTAAQAAGIPVYQPKSLRTEEAAELLKEWQPDMIVVAAFGQILRPNVLEIPSKGCLNVHASLLPRWRGAAPIQHAILAGDAETGVSLMQMEAGLDTGPVFMHQTIPITADDTAGTLHDRLADLGGRMLEKYLNDILGGGLSAKAQKEAYATYAPMIKKEDGSINWSQDSAEIGRLIRAMTPWPSAFTSWQGQTLKVLAARPISYIQLPGGPPGTVVAYKNSAMILAGEGGLQLFEVQLAGKRAMEIEEFLRGRPDFIGATLGE